MIDETINEPKMVENCCEACLHERFETLLLRQKLSQADLSKKIGVDDALVSRMVHGKESISLLTKLNVSEILQTEASIIWRECKHIKNILRILNL